MKIRMVVALLAGLSNLTSPAQSPVHSTPYFQITYIDYQAHTHGKFYCDEEEPGPVDWTQQTYITWSTNYITWDDWWEGGCPFYYQSHHCWETWPGPGMYADAGYCDNWRRSDGGYEGWETRRDPFDHPLPMLIGQRIENTPRENNGFTWTDTKEIWQSMNIDYWSGIDHPYGDAPYIPDKLRLHRLEYAVNDESGANLPPSEVTVAGKSLNEYGAVLFALPDNTVMDATPSAGGRSFNFQIGWLTKASVELGDLSSARYVTDKTNVIWAGEAVHLRCQLSSQFLATITNFNWWVEGEPIADWENSQTSGRVIPFDPSTNHLSTARFYWVAPGSYTVTCGLKVEGLAQEMYVTTRYEVKRPEAGMWRIWPRSQVQVTTDFEAPGGPDGLWRLTTGKNRDWGFTEDVGVRYDYWLSGLNEFEGSFNVTFGQLAIVHIKANRDLGAPIKSWHWDGKGNDGEWPYAHWGHQLTNTPPPLVADTPNSILEDEDRYYSRWDKFYSVLMWQSLRTDSIPVPLSLAIWTWKGQAKKIQGTTPPVWYLYDGSSPRMTYGTPLYEHPQWTNLVLAGYTQLTNDFYYPEPQ